MSATEEIFTLAVEHASDELQIKQAIARRVGELVCEYPDQFSVSVVDNKGYQSVYASTDLLTNGRRFRLTASVSREPNEVRSRVHLRGQRGVMSCDDEFYELKLVSGNETSLSLQTLVGIMGEARGIEGDLAAILERGIYAEFDVSDPLNPIDFREDWNAITPPEAFSLFEHVERCELPKGSELQPTFQDLMSENRRAGRSIGGLLCTP